MANNSITTDKSNSGYGSAKSLEEAKKLHGSSFDDNPAVYVGTYGKYNEGSLYGMWVDLTTFDCYDDFIDFCKLLHQDEDDPEFMHQDFENFPKSWYCESSMGEETFDRIIEFSKLGTDERAAYECYLDDFNSKADIEEFKEHYMGEWGSEEDFGQHIVEEFYSEKLNDDFFARYFNYEAFAKDLFIDDYYYANGYVFQR